MRRILKFSLRHSLGSKGFQAIRIRQTTISERSPNPIYQTNYTGLRVGVRDHKFKFSSITTLCRLPSYNYTVDNCSDQTNNTVPTLRRPCFFSLFHFSSPRELNIASSQELKPAALPCQGTTTTSFSPTRKATYLNPTEMLSNSSKMPPFPLSVTLKRVSSPEVLDTY